MKTERLQIKFEGEKHQIDANTLVNTLIHYSGLINEINNIYGEGTRKVDIKINAIEKGSFVIDISLIESLKDIVMFAKDNLEYAYYLGGIATSAICMYQFKQGRKAKEADSTTILNILQDNSIKIDNATFTNIYNSQVVRESISKSIETADSDSSVEGISFSSRKNKVEIRKEDFPRLIYTDFDKEDEGKNIKHVKDEDAMLRIITLSFDSKKKWEFLYKGFKISIPVKDKTLHNLIDKGLRFAKGDSIRVELEIAQEYNKEYNDYVNKKYRITEFKGHIERPTQSNLFAE